MTAEKEIEVLRAKCDRLSLRLAEEMKKVSRLALGEETPRHITDLMSMCVFHLQMAIGRYNDLLGRAAEKDRSNIEAQRRDCIDLIETFRFIERGGGKKRK